MFEELQNLKQVHPVVVLNDFFLDRIIRIKNPDLLYKQVLEKSNLGGSIRGIPQTDLKGGNATNVAYALARLGCPVSLITIADKTGQNIIKENFSQFDTASLFVLEGRPGRTTSLELDNGKDIANVMISDLGDNENFGPEKLGQKEQDEITNASAVIVTNWASNKRGTDLSEFVFSKSVSALHFLDPADIQTRAKEFASALPRLSTYLDSLCLNENECNILLQQSGLGMVSGEEKTKRLVQKLAKSYSVSIDLHTTNGSYWSDGDHVEFATSFLVEPKFVTGAGDVWDAANIAGYLVGLDACTRLRFANGAASLYVRNPLGIPPTIDQILSLVSSNPC